MKKASKSREALVLPTNIPWQLLTRSTLEECVYWLLDDLGARDLVWRSGGSGDGAPDQGRDIEASFTTTSPDDSLESQKWWIECKGRKSTVEADAIKVAANNVLSRSDVDVLAIVTNTQFSNPTRNWVEDWQRTHARPRVRLWDRHDLERMLIKHPSVVARCFAEALSMQGRLTVVRDRFWNSGVFASRSELAAFWAARNDLTFEDQDVLTLIACECAAKSLRERPWLTTLKAETARDLLWFAVANHMSLCLRGEARGTSTEPITDAVSYVLLGALRHHSIGDVIETIEGAIDRVFPTEKKAEVRAKYEELILGPCVQNIAQDMGFACATDCKRVSVDASEPTDPSEFWEGIRGHGDHAPRERDNRFLMMIDLKQQCTVGIPLREDVSCPLFDRERFSVREYLSIFKQVLAVRAPLPRE